MVRHSGRYRVEGGGFGATSRLVDSSRNRSLIPSSAGTPSLCREEMNRADRFASGGGERRFQNVGFALTILQRRLASSPAAIHESLRQWRERLEARLAEERVMKRGREAGLGAGPGSPVLSVEDEADLEDAPGDEAEAAVEATLDPATAAATIENSMPKSARSAGSRRRPRHFGAPAWTPSGPRSTTYSTIP